MYGLKPIPFKTSFHADASTPEVHLLNRLVRTLPFSPGVGTRGAIHVTYSKQRSCSPAIYGKEVRFSAFSRQILQMFTGNCESHSSKMGSAAISFPATRRHPRVSFFIISLHSS